MKFLKPLNLSVMILFVLLLGGCTNNNSKIQNNTKASTSEEMSINNEHKEIIENGYNMGAYQFYLMNFQKKNPDTLASIFNNFDETIKLNFEKYKNKIDATKKISVIPFRIQYNVSEEIVTINYFLVNNYSKDISSINISGIPIVKNVTDISPIDLPIPENDLGLLPTNGVMVMPLVFPVPIESEPKWRENKVSDLSFEISKLEINDEEIDNNN